MTFSEAVKILGLELTATKSDIRTAYRELVVKNHPDKFQDDVDKQIAERNFKRIQEAYEFLTGLQPAINVEDRMTRSGYDKDSDAIKSSLDELLKIRPVSEESFHWTDVSSTQEKFIKFLLISVPLYVLAMILFMFWKPIKIWVSGLF